MIEIFDKPDLNCDKLALLSYKSELGLDAIDPFQNGDQGAPEVKHEQFRNKRNHPSWTGGKRLEHSAPEKVTQVLKMIRSGSTYDQIQSEVGISRRSITRIRRDNPNLPPPGPRGKPLETRDPKKFNSVIQALSSLVPVRLIAL